MTEEKVTLKDDDIKYLNEMISSEEKNDERVNDILVESSSPQSYDDIDEYDKDFDIFDDVKNELEQENSCNNTDIEDDNSCENTEEEIDFQEETLKDIEDFDKKAHSKKHGYKIPNFKFMEDKLEGLESGMYLFAAESNVGKSAVVSNIIYDICTCEENKLFGIYYSLDDTRQELMPRMIASVSSIPISVASKPCRYEDALEDESTQEEDKERYEEFLERRKDGLNEMKEKSKFFKIEDSNRIDNSDKLLNHMKNVQKFIKKKYGEDYDIIVAIDSLDDIRICDGIKRTTTDEHSFRAMSVKQWANDLGIPIFGTRHLLKIKQDRRPTLDDMKDSGTYQYEASAIFMLYSDVSKNKESAKVFYEGNDSGESSEKCKMPVIECEWAKNKKSSYKGNSYFYFFPNFSKIKEVNEAGVKYYDNILFS